MQVKYKEFSPTSHMKHYLMILIFGAFAAAPALADTYSATLTGIECNACKKTIATSIGKLKGVKTIRIVKTGENTHRMTVITDGQKAISKAEAERAIKKAEHYKIKSWSKTG